MPMIALLLAATMTVAAQTTATAASPQEDVTRAEQPQMQTTSASDAPDLPVSIARIRAALERPDVLTLPRITPDFVVDVRERQRFDKLVPPMDFRSGPVPPGGLYAYEQLQRSGVSAAQPLLLIDLIAIGHEISRAHAAHEAASAREEVRQAIADYCAAQPAGGAGIAICVK
jgi:hypothetical protein